MRGALEKMHLSIIRPFAFHQFDFMEYSHTSV